MKYVEKMWGTFDIIGKPMVNSIVLYMHEHYKPLKPGELMLVVNVVGLINFL